jgi:hypothetical protein
MLNKLLPVIIAFVALLSAVFWNNLNLENLKAANIPLRNNQTVITEDDASYLNPYLRLYKNGKKNETAFDKFSSSIRPPGYGLIYYLTLKFSGESNALFVLKIIQCLLFSFSVFCLYELSLFFTKSNWLASITAIIYGLLPFSIGFLYYTLTEGITPALFVISVYLMVKMTTEKEVRFQLLYLLFAGGVFSILLITRPFLIIFLPLFIFGLFFNWIKQKGLKVSVLNTFLFLLLSLSGIVTWQIKSKLELGKWIGLHPIYQNEIPGVFRKPHASLWELFKGWESNGAHFHETIVPFWEATMTLDTSQNQIDKVIAEIPNNVVKSIGKQELIWAFRLYQRAIIAQKSYFDKKKLMPSYLLKEELRATKNFDRLAIKFSSNNLYQYHIQTTLKVAKSMIFHSNLSLHQFQHAYRGKIWMEILRLLCFGIHSLAFLILPFAFFALNDARIRLLIFGILIYCFYLIYFQRGIEERYTLPLLPFVLMIGVMTIYYLISLLKKVKFKKISLFK